MEREIDWRKAIVNSLRETVRLCDEVPLRDDFAIEFKVPHFALRASLLHFGMEQGMKALIKRDGMKYDRGHDLCRAYKALPLEMRQLLDGCFEDARDFYQIEIVEQRVHLKSLEQYLLAIGSHKQFEDYRYWALEKADDWFANPVMELRITRELVRFIADELSDSGEVIGDPFFLSARLERSLKHCFPRRIPPHWSEDDSHQHYQDAYRLRNEAGSWLQVLEIAVRENFAGQEGVQLLLHRQYEAFLNAKEMKSDPAFRHALDRMTAIHFRLSSNLKADLDETRDDWIVVRAPGSDLPLGDCIRRPDGRWWVSLGRSNGSYLAADRQSAIDLAIAGSTEEIYVQVNDGKPRKHWIVDEFRFPSGFRETAEGAELCDPEMSAEFWHSPDWLPVGASVKLWKISKWYDGEDQGCESSTAVVLKVEDRKATLQFDEVPMFRMGKPDFLEEDENATELCH